MRAIGLDISLTSTGYADVQSIGRDYSLTSTAFKTDPANPNPSLLDRHNRARTIEDDIIRRIFAGPVPDLVAGEAPSAGSKFGDPHDRSGLWWGIVARVRSWRYEGHQGHGRGRGERPVRVRADPAQGVRP